MISSQLMLVTGASSGIGSTTALGLAKQGAHVILHARDRAKGQAVIDDIRAKVPAAQVDLALADLSRQSEIHQLAAHIQQTYGRLDVLVNNAAIMPRQRTLGPDGIELQLAVNHLAYFLLTCLLLDLLKAAPQGRVVNVSSAVHHGAALDLNDLQVTNAYGQFGLTQYSSTKLMNVLFTVELAQRLAGTQVTANCLHPGVIDTNLWRDASIVKPISRLFFSSSLKGAETSLHLATNPTLSKVTGKYFNNQKLAAYDSRADNPALRAQLWEISAKMTGIGST